MSATLQAYRRWAPHYPASAHNPLMRAEERAMQALWPEVAGKAALDLACGTGRYAQLLAATKAQPIVAVDFCMSMLARAAAIDRVCALMDQLPFRDGEFAAVVSGLALGHAEHLGQWMHEVARVLQCGGTLLYSDFHPDAARAGLPRNFRDSDGALVNVPHRCHGIAAQQRAAAAAGLLIETLSEVRIGLELNETFRGCEEFYRRWHGLPVVLVVRATRVTS